MNAPMTAAAAAAEVPAAKGMPVLGHTVQLLRDPLRFARSVYDLGPMVAVRVGPEKLVFVNDAMLIRQVLVDKANSFDKGRQYEKMRDLWLGGGLATSEGALHMRQRRLMQPAFHHRQVAHYLDAMRSAVQERVSSWPADEVFQLDEEFYSLVLTMGTHSLFSASIDPEDIATLRRTLKAVLDWIGWLCLDTTELLEKVPIAANRRFHEAVDTMRVTIEKIIDDHVPGQFDLLSMLQDVRDEDTGETMSRQQVYDEVLTIMMAGSETTHTALNWVCHLLSQHPDIQEAVQAEVDGVLGGRGPAPDDLDKLALTRRVITEAIRMYPPVWLLSRRAATDVEIGSYRIPAGTQVCFSTYAVQRDPLLYANPDRFDPDRWLPGPDTPHRTSNLSFGAGKRGCIGEPVAWSQMMVTTATIMQKWTLRPAPGVEIKPRPRMLLPVASLPMVLKPRAGANF